VKIYRSTAWLDERKYENERPPNLAHETAMSKNFVLHGTRVSVTVIRSIVVLKASPNTVQARSRDQMEERDWMDR
jgi:hypothetical protein